MGVAGVSDNARWIRATNGCTVANYYSEPLVPLEVQIQGDDRICYPFVATYYAGVSGTNTPYSFLWHISLDGINWGSPVSTAQGISINSVNYSIGTTLFLRVRVTDSSGKVVFGFFKVAIIDSNSYICYRSNGSNVDNGADLKVYPNPTDDHVSIAFRVGMDDVPVHIEVFTITGRKVAEIHRNLNHGDHTEGISGREMVPGLLLLKVRVGDKQYEKLITKL